MDRYPHKIYVDVIKINSTMWYWAIEQFGHGGYSFMCDNSGVAFYFMNITDVTAFILHFQL